MTFSNPLSLTLKNIAKEVDTLQEILKLSSTKPVLVVIKAEWCGYCQLFAKFAWNKFRDDNTPSPRFQIVEIDHEALGWISTNIPALHKKLLIEPSRVYFPQVYMVIKEKKKVFQPNYLENEALATLNKWVNDLIPQRKMLRRTKKATGGSVQSSVPKAHQQKRTLSNAAKKSLKAEIDAAFKKLLLR
jgi:thioredoxin-related protein